MLKLSKHNRYRKLSLSFSNKVFENTAKVKNKEHGLQQRVLIARNFLINLDLMMFIRGGVLQSRDSFSLYQSSEIGVKINPDKTRPFILCKYWLQVLFSAITEYTWETLKHPTVNSWCAADLANNETLEAFYRAWNIRLSWKRIVF